jgi:branched-chain amino acid transport system permease protein
MMLGQLSSQFMTGLANASALFLISCGLTIILGVARVVNFAHGSFFMLGAYLGGTLMKVFTASLGPALGFWLAIPAAGLAVGVIGLTIEIVLIRRIYRAPELFQILLTFGIVLIVQDLVLWTWGAEEQIGMAPPGLNGSLQLFGRHFPQYELFLLALGPVALVALWLLFHRSRWGILVRAATDDREMAAILGVREARLFSSVFCLGTALAGLAGALQLPREPANLGMDVTIVIDAFVITVIGGMGSVVGAYLAAILVGVLQVMGVIAFPKMSLVLLFVIMTAVLAVRPNGLLGRPIARYGGPQSVALSRPSRWPTSAVGCVIVALVLLPLFVDSFTLRVCTEVLIAAVFGFSLSFILNIGGAVSFGHAAYFGLGAYVAALATSYVPMEAAILLALLASLGGAFLFGWFVTRLSGIYFAMLTLAVAQILWSIAFQWVDVTGGDNGVVGIVPSGWAQSRISFYYMSLILSIAAVGFLYRAIFAPFGYSLRATRDSPLRASAMGIDPRQMQWFAFAIAGGVAGLAGCLFAYSSGSIDPGVLGVRMSLDGLIIVLIGGVQTLAGPIVGALVYTFLKTHLLAVTEHWRLVLGFLIVFLSILFPSGLMGSAWTAHLALLAKRVAHAWRPA